MKAEHFSIIMPAFNASATIEQSIESVLGQSYQSWTLYVVDDCSSDNTSKIIKSFSRKDERVIYHKMAKNSGVAAARNFGISAADGQYISFLDSDDVWTSDKLQRQLIHLKSGYEIVCSNYNTFVNSTSEVLSVRLFPEKFEYEDMLVSNKIGNLTGTYDQIKLGKVYQTKSGHEDYIMWLELVRRSRCVYCVQEILAFYRVSKNSLSANKIRASRWQWNVYRKYLGLGISQSIYYWLRYAFNALSR